MIRIWADFEKEDPMREKELFVDVFDLHPLVITDPTYLKSTHTQTTADYVLEPFLILPNQCFGYSSSAMCFTRLLIDDLSILVVKLETSVVKLRMSV